MEMAKKEICNKINSWNPASLSNASNKPKAFDEEMDEKDEGNGKDAPSMKPDAPNPWGFVDSDVVPARKKPDPMSMNVPDPDFHDFDQDCTEKSFSENQV
ncbi:hypothetical protein CRYUN_Cryun12cG0175100 [Craigia yunnanensis]